MITIAHGSDTASSRKFYIDEREKAQTPTLLEGKNISYDTIFQALEGKSLFENSSYLFLENFFSNIKSNSNEYKRIVEYINSNSKFNIFLWEEKELSKPQQFVFKEAQLKTFNYPANLFAFLDSLKPGNNHSVSLFKELENTMEVELIFYMMVRQFRLLLSTLSANHLIDEAKRLAPWQRSKLIRQSSYFGEDKLKELYRKLYKIDYQTKFGLTPFGLSASIDIFLLDL